MSVAARLLGGVLKSFAWRPIEAQVVARAVLAIAHDPPMGAQTYPSDQLHGLGRSGAS